MKYTITKFRSTAPSSRVDFVLKENGKYNSQESLVGVWSLYDMLYHGACVTAGDWEIYEVKDEEGKVYKVGDLADDGSGYTITGFRYENGGIWFMREQKEKLICYVDSTPIYESTPVWLESPYEGWNAFSGKWETKIVETVGKAIYAYLGWKIYDRDPRNEAHKYHTSDCDCVIDPYKNFSLYGPNRYQKNEIPNPSLLEEWKNCFEKATNGKCVVGSKKFVGYSMDGYAIYEDTPVWYLIKDGSHLVRNVGSKMSYYKNWMAFIKLKNAYKMMEILNNK